ncbi:MAG: hypothetical protein WBD53_06955 [Xanthobacteraceae bacterium]
MFSAATQFYGRRCPPYFLFVAAALASTITEDKGQTRDLILSKRGHGFRIAASRLAG